MNAPTSRSHLRHYNLGAPQRGCLMPPCAVGIKEDHYRGHERGERSMLWTASLREWVPMIPKTFHKEPQRVPISRQSSDNEFIESLSNVWAGLTRPRLHTFPPEELPPEPAVYSSKIQQPRVP